MCIFCEIVKGNIPSSKIYEDDKFIAILDIAQTTKGHCLVIPKEHYANMLECPEEEYAQLMKLVKKLALNNKNKLKANGINILINTGEAAGQTVEHLHVHIIPRYTDEDTINIEFKENKFDLEEIRNTLI